MQFITPEYTITQSNSHEDSWIFKCKDGSFFMLNASEEFIREAYGEEEEEK